MVCVEFFKSQLLEAFCDYVKSPVLIWFLVGWLFFGFVLITLVIILHVAVEESSKARNTEMPHLNI